MPRFSESMDVCIDAESEVTAEETVSLLPETATAEEADLFNKQDRIVIAVVAHNDDAPPTYRDGCAQVMK